MGLDSPALKTVTMLAYLLPLVTVWKHQ